ncbi:glycosyl hydrolase family 2 [Mucilaginibacter mali]|uniref:Glycosyl hydrolase family 2 n=1 Tax=Mucilaginibacter mali TaxID=2740462 RepID=A0A7D4PSJ2_9SPHI|nr:glycoside hydrolase family 2 TIM barrel-domain containing protein [Mucilaginibacter mali]QKJ29023.1 glycosyl hydrolase family 2 [Mucilaginibacter mali]
MKRTLLFVWLICMTAFAGYAKPAPAYAIIPFTGMDYIRVEVDAAYQTSAQNTFKLVIKSVADGNVLWQGDVKPTEAINIKKGKLAFTVNGLKPILWQPTNPYLYQVSLQQYSNGQLQDELKERAGFRSFERRGGSLYLNGKPIFLRGIAINPPGRGIPAKIEESRAFALEYVRYMKSINVNIIRIPDAEEWYDVCDELGMMVFGGNYSGKVAGGEKVDSKEQFGDETDGGFPKDYDRGVDWYENTKFHAIAQHPSLMVYAMTNETPFAGSRAAPWEKFLAYAYDKLKKWDETRVYIANAGYGYGKAGDICDIHRYWGWYYSSPYTFLNIRDNSKIIPFPKHDQPITFTECVGNYTGPDGRYNLTPAHKNPSSQLAWTGHAEQGLQSKLADEHQSSTFRYATELFRQLRAVNHDLSGVFPFTILFYNWDTVEKFGDMHPKPVTDQVKISYQPVLLSWECWTKNVYAGSTFNPIAHVINDDEHFEDLKDLKMICQLRDKAHVLVYTDTIAMPNVAYYSSAQKQLQIKLPVNLASGYYKLTGELWSGGKVVSHNFFDIFISGKQFIPQSPVLDRQVLVYDKGGKLKSSLEKLNIPSRPLTSWKNLPLNKVVIIGDNAADNALAQNAASIKDFISKGGRILCLRQDSAHRLNLNKILDSKLANSTVDIDHPVYPVSANPPRNGYYINYERPDHPVFAGVTRANLRVFSDYSGWSENQKGMPEIYPVKDGFTLENRDGVSNTAILGNYGSGLQAIAVAEQFIGKGSIVLSGMDLLNRTGLDPVADRLLLNLVTYTSANAGHVLYQAITGPIIWGDYETEKGIVTDYYSGFLVNSTPRLPDNFVSKRPIVVTREGYQLAGGSRAGFNTHPGIQYVANGRRPWGPYVQTFGGQPKMLTDSVTDGTARFWCRIPAGQNMSTSLVWNPGDEPISIKIKVNNLPGVKQTIKPGDKVFIKAPVNSDIVNMTFTGDRRAVVLETAFGKR